MIPLLLSESFPLFAAAATAAVALALAAPPARAATVTLWACHGPAGQPLGTGPLIPSNSADGVSTTYGSGCSGQAGTLADGGMAATFGRPDPLAGSSAGWRVDVPPATTLTALALTRATSGFGGAPQPGDPLVYQAGTPAGPLESVSLADSSNLALSGTASFPAVSGESASFGVSCGQTAQGRCAGSGTAGVDVSAMALTVSDTEAPRVAVGGVEDPVAGALPLHIQATDAGVGLRSATAKLDGQPSVTVALGGPNCTPLPSSATGTDLPLGADCPTSVADVPLTVSAAVVKDGSHKLTVTVADAAGNTTTAVDREIAVRNHLIVPGSSAIISVGSGGQLPEINGTGGGAGSSPGGGPPVCISPALAASLASRPLSVARSGVAVLWGGTRYLFTGRLTCVVKRRRVGAPNRTVVDIRSLIGHRIVPRTGAAVYAGGIFRVLLHPRTTRTIEFRFGSGNTRRSVSIPVIVTPYRGQR